MSGSATRGLLFRVIAAAGLLVTGWVVAEQNVWGGLFLGIPTQGWVAAALGVTLLHHAACWFAWRWELHHRTLSRRFGDAGGARWMRLLLYGGLALQLLAMLGAAKANFDTLNILAGGATWPYLLAPALLFVYALVAFPLAFRRHRGARETFRQAWAESPRLAGVLYHEVPTVLHSVGLLLPWLLAVSCSAGALLGVALFNHADTILHYMTTEKPDEPFVLGADSSVRAEAPV